MDCLALYECGFKNVVSVPNGAGLGKINFDYLDNSIDSFSEDTQFILAVDNDQAGQNLQNELARRLGFENCTYVRFKDCKDANDCLIKYGIQGVTEAMNAAKEFPIEGVFNANDIEEEIYSYYNNGLPKGSGIGMAEIDNLIRFQEGYLTTITGIPGHGKSEFLDFILCKLNVSHEWKTALYSPENHPLELHFSKFAEKITGKSFEGVNRMSPADLRQMIDYHAKNFFFINPKENFTLDNILDSVRSLVRKKGIKAFVIDAWNKLDHQYTTSETKYISEQLDKIVMFCERNKVHCFLVAHPTKISKNRDTGLYEVPNLYSISGSANFYNKTANGLTVYRNYETGQTEVYIQKVKFKHWGQTGCVHLGWDSTNGRYFKDTPNYDNWINMMPSRIQENTDFLIAGADIITSKEPLPF
jgi:twinkle protein